MEGARALYPDWPAPPSVHAFVTTRDGGFSTGAYASLNLGDHVGDDPQVVAANRERVRKSAALPAEPHWLQQVHGRVVVDLATASLQPVADGAVSFAPGAICAILTADCLPVLLCDRAGQRVAAAHAGWRGLAAGVLAETVTSLNCPPAELIAWLGPAIGPDAFEVGAEVRAAFLQKDSAGAACFRPNRAHHWLADIYELARRELRLLGVKDIFGGGYCTYSERERFYSYRRDGVTGRMAALIWIEPC
ncbi:MAG: peptidoglycan editing factor PgeF [Nevskiales bacterium]